MWLVISVTIVIFYFHNAEHKELPVIKIVSDEGREDCQQLKPKGTLASLGTTVIAVTILLILSVLFSRMTVMYLFLYCALCFSCNCVYCDAVHVRCSASGFCIISKFCVKSVLVSVRLRQVKVMSQLYGRKIVLWRK